MKRQIVIFIVLSLIISCNESHKKKTKKGKVIKTVQRLKEIPLSGLWISDSRYLKEFIPIKGKWQYPNDYCMKIDVENKKIIHYVYDDNYDIEKIESKFIELKRNVYEIIFPNKKKDNFSIVYDSYQKNYDLVWNYPKDQKAGAKIKYYEHNMAQLYIKDDISKNAVDKCMKEIKVNFEQDKKPTGGNLSPDEMENFNKNKK